MTILEQLPADLREGLRVTDSGCWEWSGSRLPAGYGRIQFAGTRWYTHRLSYTFAVGPIPPGLTIDHLCRNTACANPAHLEAVTSQTNTLRGQTVAAANVAKTHCPQGHPYDEDNTYKRPDGQRSRDCHVCRHEASERHNDRRRLARAATREGLAR